MKSPEPKLGNLLSMSHDGRTKGQYSFIADVVVAPLSDHIVFNHEIQHRDRIMVAEIEYANVWGLLREVVGVSHALLFLMTVSKDPQDKRQLEKLFWYIEDIISFFWDHLVLLSELEILLATAPEGDREFVEAVLSSIEDEYAIDLTESWILLDQFNDNRRDQVFQICHMLLYNSGIVNRPENKLYSSVFSWESEINEVIERVAKSIESGGDEYFRQLSDAINEISDIDRRGAWVERVERNVFGWTADELPKKVARVRRMSPQLGRSLVTLWKQIIDHDPLHINNRSLFANGPFQVRYATLWKQIIDHDPVYNWSLFANSLFQIRYSGDRRLFRINMAIWDAILEKENDKELESLGGGWMDELLVWEMLREAFKRSKLFGTPVRDLIDCPYCSSEVEIVTGSELIREMVEKVHFLQDEDDCEVCEMLESASALLSPSSTI